MFHLTKILCAFIVFAACTARAVAEEGGEEGGDQLLKTFVGTWKVTGSTGGMELDGTFVAKWGSSKSCVVSDYKFTLGETPLVGNHIFGFDAATQSYRVLGFFSHGVVEDYHYKKEKGGVYKGKYAGSSEGQKFEGDLTVTVSDDCLKFESSGLKRGGQPRPELSATLTRVKD